MGAVGCGNICIPSIHEASILDTGAVVLLLLAKAALLCCGVDEFQSAFGEILIEQIDCACNSDSILLRWTFYTIFDAG